MAAIRCAVARHTTGVANVNRTDIRESATIIPFPVRTRVGVSHREAEIEDLPVVDVASWYHEAAMLEDEKTRTH